MHGHFNFLVASPHSPSALNKIKFFVPPHFRNVELIEEHSEQGLSKQCVSPIGGSTSNNEVNMLGAPGGPEIENKNSILSDIDRVLGVSKPPAIEFIFVEPYPLTILYLFSYFIILFFFCL